MIVFSLKGHKTGSNEKSEERDTHHIGLSWFDDHQQQTDRTGDCVYIIQTYIYSITNIKHFLYKYDKAYDYDINIYMYVYVCLHII